MCLSCFRTFVTDPVHRQDVSRLSWIGLDLASEVLDVRVDRAIERLALLATERVEQLSAREHASRVPRHHRQELEFSRCEIDRLTRSLDEHARYVEREIGNAQEVAALEPRRRT